MDDGSSYRRSNKLENKYLNTYISGPVTIYIGTKNI